MRSNVIKVTPENTLYRLACDQLEAKRLKEVQQNYRGIFLYDDIIGYIAAFLTDQNFIKVTGLSRALLFFRYALALERHPHVKNAPKVSIFRFQFYDSCIPKFLIPMRNSFKLKTPFNLVSAVAISRCGAYIAATSTNVDSGWLTLWNAKTGEDFPLAQSEEYGGDAIAFSPDSTQIAFTAYTAIFKIIDIASEKIVEIPYPGSATDATQSSKIFYRDNGSIVTAWNDNTISVWNCVTKKYAQVFKCTASTDLNETKILPFNKNIFIESVDLKITILDYDGRSRNTVRLFEDVDSPDDDISACALSSNQEYFIAGTHKGRIAIWDWKNNIELPMEFMGSSKKIFGMAFSNDNGYFVVVSDTLKIGEIKTRKWIAEKKLEEVPTSFFSDGIDKIILGFHGGIEFFSVRNLLLALSPSEKNKTMPG